MLIGGAVVLQALPLISYFYISVIEILIMIMTTINQRAVRSEVVVTCLGINHFELLFDPVHSVRDVVLQFFLDLLGHLFNFLLPPLARPCLIRVGLILICFDI